MELRDPSDFQEFWRTFPADGYTGMVIVDDIGYVALCEHHLFPFMGRAAIGYIPKHRIAGLSKLPRFVKWAAKQGPTTQEHLTKHIADSLMTLLNAEGVIVVMEGEHTCMTIRGVESPGTKTVTSHVLGAFTNPETRSEFHQRRIEQSGR